MKDSQLWSPHSQVYPTEVQEIPPAPPQAGSRNRKERGSCEEGGPERNLVLGRGVGSHEDWVGDKWGRPICRRRSAGALLLIASEVNYEPLGPLDSLRNIVHQVLKERGWRGLWRGRGPRAACSFF